MIIDPSTIVKLRDTGTGDMATLADRNPAPRFTMDRQFVLMGFLAWAFGGTGNATLTLHQKIPSRPDGVYDRIRRTWVTFGATSGDAFVTGRTDATDDRNWILGPGELWVPVWTNPDSGNMTWVLEVQLAAVIG